MGFPAILKGYLDRVLSYDFAYTNGEPESIGLLRGKKMQQFVTIGNPNEKYQRKGFLDAFEHTLGNGLFNFCGIENVQMHYFGGVGLKETDYAAILQEVVTSCAEMLSQWAGGFYPKMLNHARAGINPAPTNKLNASASISPYNKRSIFQKNMQIFSKNWPLVFESRLVTR